MSRWLLSGLLLSAAATAQNTAIRYNPGFFSTTVSRGDDATSDAIPLGFIVNFQGRFHSAVYINTNGNMTFSRPLESFLPVPLSQLRADIIAPFYADADTRGPDTRVVSFGYDLADGHFALAANWLDTGYFAQKQDKKNGFQAVIVDRTDTGAGNFDIELNYGYIKWETGDLSGGVNGIGGVAARAGYSSGTATYELPGSGLAGSFLDTSATGLIRRSLNSTVPGRIRFESRGGVILQSLQTNPGALTFSLPPRIVAVRNLSLSSTGNPIRATVTSNVAWLQPLPAGITTPAAIQAQVNTGIMPPGLYLGQFTVTPDNPTVAPVQVPVTLSVGQPAPSCTYTLNATSITVSAALGRFAVNVTAPPGCSWRAASNADWIRIDSGSEGGGDGSVVFDVLPNPSLARGSTLTVAGTSFAVLQGSAQSLPVADSRVCRIETLAGNGDAAYYGDGVINAAATALNRPLGVFATQSNDVFVADTLNQIVRRWSPGFVKPVQALRFQPAGIGYDTQGNIYVSDAQRHQVYRITFDGRFELFAGAGDAGYGEPGYSGDYGLARDAKLNAPRGIAAANNGVIYIADSGNHVIRAVDREGIIRTYAGRGIPGFAGDNDYASNALLNRPEGLAFDNKSNLYVADTGNHRIRRISPEALSTTIAGTFESGFSADGQLALRSRFNAPSGVAADTLGNVFVADRGNHRIRMIRSDGLVFTVAGNGVAGFNGDGIGTLSLLSSPQAVSVDADDRIVVADTGNNRLRRIACAPGLLPSETVPRISDAISTASSLPRVTSLSYLTLRGVNLALTTAAWDDFFPDANTLPTEVAGVRVRVNGKLAYPYFVSPTAVTVITPDDNVSGAVPVELTNENGAAFTVAEIAPYAPAIYVTPFNGRDYALVQYANEAEFVTPERPAAAGDKLVLLAAGLGPVFPPVPEGRPLATPSFVPTISSLKLFIDGKEIALTSAYMRSLGLFQLEFTMPAGIEGDVTVEVRAGGQSSQSGVVLAAAVLPQ